MNQQSVALSVENVTKRFGGVTALKDVSFVLKVGECHALIGPNGAGKTTFFNVITGELRPDKGQIFLFGKNITHTSVQERVQLGLARTYQVVNLFEGLTVKESIVLGLRKFWSSKFASTTRISSIRRCVDEEVERLATQVGLVDCLASRVRALSHGDKRKLDIALALATKPRVLLLDEPVAGLTAAERVNLGELLHRMLEETDLSIVLVEHDVSFAFELSDRVTVLDHGTVIFEGSPDEVRSSEIVMKLYFGE